MKKEISIIFPGSWPQMKPLAAALFCVVCLTAILSAQSPVDLFDSVLITYFLTPQQEAQFSHTDGVASPFWQDWGDRDELRIAPPDNCWPGKCRFADTTDASMLVRAGATARGVYLYAEIEDDTWVVGRDHRDNRMDVAVFITDLLSSDSIWACADCPVGFYDGMLTFYTHVYEVPMGLLAPASGLVLQYMGWGAWERISMTFETAYQYYGLRAELAVLSPSRRAVELFIPWRSYWFSDGSYYWPPGIVAGTPLAGRRFGFAVGYDDGDIPGDTIGVLRWLGKDPWTSDNYTVNYWADLLMADNMPPAGFYADEAIVVQIYPYAGAPHSLNNPAYPPVSTRTIVDQGDTVPLVAKLFDSLSQSSWKKQYERPEAPVKWRVWTATGDTGAAWLTDSSGCCVGLVCGRSWATVYVEATWDDGLTARVSDTVAFLVRDTTPPIVYIEGSADRTVSPNTPNPLNEVILGPGHPTTYVYAILRDHFGNYVTPCWGAQWRSLDTAVVTVAAGIDSLGEGAITAGRFAGSTRVAVHCSECDCGDTLAVLSSYPNQAILTAASARRPDPSIPVRVYDLRGRLTANGTPYKGISLRVTEHRTFKAVDLTGR